MNYISIITYNNYQRQKYGKFSYNYTSGENILDKNKRKNPASSSYITPAKLFNDFQL